MADDIARRSDIWSQGTEGTIIYGLLSATTRRGRNIWSSAANFSAKDHQSRARAFCKLVFDWLIPAPNLQLVGSTGPDIPSDGCTYQSMINSILCQWYGEARLKKRKFTARAEGEESTGPWRKRRWSLNFLFVEDITIKISAMILWVSFVFL